MKKLLVVLIPAVLLSTITNATYFYSDDSDDEATQYAMAQSLIDLQGAPAGFHVAQPDFPAAHWSDSEEDDIATLTAIYNSFADMYRKNRPRVDNINHNNAQPNAILRYRLCVQGDEPQFPFQTTGLSAMELDHTWSEGEEKMVTMRIPHVGGAVNSRVTELEFENVAVFTPQIVTILLNQEILGNVEFTPARMIQSIVVPFPPDLTEAADIVLLTPGARRPDNGDPRILGLNFRTALLRFDQANGVPPAAASSNTNATAPRDDEKRPSSAVHSDVKGQDINYMHELFTAMEKEFFQKLIQLEEERYLNAADRKLPLMEKWLQYELDEALALAFGTQEYDTVFENYNRWKETEVPNRIAELTRIARARMIPNPKIKEDLINKYVAKHGCSPEFAKKVHKVFKNGGL